MRIFLFDIDGTLVNTGGAGGDALRHAFCHEFSVSDAGRVSFCGRTDRAIGRDFFQLHRVENNAENWNRLRTSYLERLPRYMPRYQGQVLPGVLALLDALSQAEDAILGLLTGNLREGARIKLEFFNVYRFFPFGGFGDEHYDREGVAQDAIAAARDHLAAIDGQTAAEQVWVIGDTPLDVACARAIDARALAVATGFHRRDELAAAEPDLLLDELSNTPLVLEALATGR